MAGEHPDSDWGACQAGPLRIEYARGVMEQIRAAALEGFRAARHGGVEVGGLLFGERDAQSVRITGWCPLACEHALGPGFRLSEKDKAMLAQSLEQARRQGLEPVGWYHSHTRSELELSREDLEIHERYFPEPWQVALLVRPYRADETRACFFGWADARGRRVASSPEFLVEPCPGAAVDSPPVQLSPPVTATPPPAAPQPVESTYRLQKRGRFRLLFAVALLIAGIFAAWSYYSKPGAPVRLRVTEQRGWLIIAWDNDSPTIRQAATGALEIVDGPRHTRLQLGAVQLKEGTVWYPRESERVEVRLRLSRRWRRPVEESALFIGASPASSAQASAEADALRQALRERQELMAELEQVRKELAAQRARNAQLEETIRLLRQRLEIESARGR